MDHSPFFGQPQYRHHPWYGSAETVTSSPSLPSSPVGTIISSSNPTPSSAITVSPAPGSSDDPFSSSPISASSAGQYTSATLPSVSVVPSSATSAASKSLSALSQTRVNAGAITGGVIGGLVLFAMIVLGIIYYMQRRRRLHTAPSAEFMSGRTPMVAPGSTPGSGHAESFNSTSQLARNLATSQYSASVSYDGHGAATAAPPAFTRGNYFYPSPGKLSSMTPL
ncbi:hypothetical protein GGU10DRAFT_353025 [Lentinula aff. detonsa]|uniref:Uncharacterized protein n=1 Tax=Lentinula aff. detonsa TaxID=2804958 RepID=A0AA38L4R8_9AGAR|nr:hypothetical protein GGU10DRAFT_353025 [Lentinula aff. detonsa]